MKIQPPAALRVAATTAVRTVAAAATALRTVAATALPPVAAAVALFAFSAAAGDEPLFKWRSARGPAAAAATPTAPVAPAVSVSVEPDRRVLASDMPESASVRITLSGVPNEGGERAAVNAAFVLVASVPANAAADAAARKAAEDAVARLDERDAVAVVPSGGLFAGVAAGAAALRKNLARGLENRLFVVSAGGAKADPDESEDFELLGASLAKEGIAVSAVVAGSGGEDGAVAALARASGGDARFAVDAAALPGLVAEALEDAFRTAAREASVSVRFRDAFPVALEEAEGRIEDGVVSVRFGPVAAGRKKSVLVHVEFPAGKDGETREFARAEAAWTRPGGGGSGRAAAVGSVAFSVDAAPAL